MTLYVSPDGNVSFLGMNEPDLESLGNVRKTRASHVVPAGALKRAAFRLVRMFGETGRAADWTRRWRGPWKAVLVGTGESFTAKTRQECIDWEVATLTGRLSE